MKYLSPREKPDMGPFRSENIRFHMTTDWPTTAVLWALDAAKPGEQVDRPGHEPRRQPAGALTIRLTARVHETGRRFEQPELQALTHHQIENILADITAKGWAHNNGSTPSHWIITQAGLDECQRRRGGPA
jgi:hypothetical protein